MALLPPIFQQNSAYSARVTRWLVSMVGSAGVVGNGYEVTQRGAGANMSVDVAAGQAFVQGTDQTNQGRYLCVSEQIENLTISASDPSNPRIDLVCIVVKDPNAGGAAGDEAVVEIVEGTPSGAPSAPAAPASSLVIAEVAVGAGVTTILNANITDRRGARSAATLSPPTLHPFFLMGA